MQNKKKKLKALKALQFSLGEYHAQHISGESYHKLYKKYAEVFRLLTSSDMATERGMKSYFKDQAKRSKGFINWKFYNKQLKKVLKATDIDDFFLVNWNKERLSMKVILTKTLVNAIVAGGIQTENDTNINIGWSAGNEAVQDFLRKHTLELAGGITKTTQNRIIKALRLSIDLGESTSEAADRINDVIDDPVRSAVIAHTESVRAFTEGRLEVAKQIGANRKQWDATVGACEICIPMDGEVVKLKETFKRAGDGIARLAPPAHPNCRCIVKIFMPNEKITRSS